MKREFKFEVGKYVKVINQPEVPNFPCKIVYRFFDRKNIVYIIAIGDGNETPILEEHLELYIDNNNSDTIQQMQKEILDLQKRITDLEFEVSKANQELKGFSLPTSKVASGNERRYDDAGDGNMPNLSD